MNAHLIILAVTLAAGPLAAGEWRVLDDDWRPIETIAPGIMNDQLTRRDPSGGRIGTVEQRIGDRLIILDTDRRRQATVEPGIGDRMVIKDPSGRRIGTAEPGIGGQIIIKDGTGTRIGTVTRR
jgi:hypothetical protein